MYSDLEEKHEEARYWFFVAVIFFALSFSVLAGVHAVVKPDMQGNPEIQLKVYAEYVAEIAGVDLYNDSDIDRPPPNPTTYEDVVRSLLSSSDEMQYRFSPDYIKIAKGFSDDMAQMFLNKLEAFDMKSITQRTVHLDHVAGLDKINVRLMDAYKKLMETSMVGDKLRDLALKVMAGSIVNQLINSSRTLMPEQMGGTMFWRWIEKGDLPFNFVFLHDIEGDMGIGTDTVTDCGMVVEFDGDNKTANQEKMDKALDDYFDFFVENPLMSSLYTHCWIIGLDPSDSEGDVNVTQVGSVFETQLMKFGTSMVLEERYGDDLGLVSSEYKQTSANSKLANVLGGGQFARIHHQGLNDAFGKVTNYRKNMKNLATKLVDVDIFYALNEGDQDFLKQNLRESFSINDFNFDENGRVISANKEGRMNAKMKLPFWAYLAMMGIKLEHETGMSEDEIKAYKEMISYMIVYPALLLMNDPRLLKDALLPKDEDQEFGEHYRWTFGNIKRENRDPPGPKQGKVIKTAPTDGGTVPKDSVTRDEAGTVCFWNIIGMFAPPALVSSTKSDAMGSLKGVVDEEDYWLKGALNFMMPLSIEKWTSRTTGRKTYTNPLSDAGSTKTAAAAKAQQATQAVDFYVAKKSVKNMIVHEFFKMITSGSGDAQYDKINEADQARLKEAWNVDDFTTGETAKDSVGGLDAVAVKAYTWWKDKTYSSDSGHAYFPVEWLTTYKDNYKGFKDLYESDSTIPEDAKNKVLDEIKDIAEGKFTDNYPAPIFGYGNNKEGSQTIAFKYEGSDSWKGALVWATHSNVLDYWNEFIPYRWQQKLALDRDVFVFYGSVPSKIHKKGSMESNIKYKIIRSGDASEYPFWTKKGEIWTPNIGQNWDSSDPDNDKEYGVTSYMPLVQPMKKASNDATAVAPWESSSVLAYKVIYQIKIHDKPTNTGATEFVTRGSSEWKTNDITENPEYPGMYVRMSTDETGGKHHKDWIYGTYIARPSGSFRKGALTLQAVGEKPINPYAYWGAYEWRMFDTLWGCGVVSCLGPTDENSATEFWGTEDKLHGKEPAKGKTYPEEPVSYLKNY